MAHDHAHAHHHDHDHADSHGRLLIALMLIVSFMLVEVAGGLISGSLALLADAGHMLTDAASLGLAVLAIRIARRPADAKRTYGFGRMRVLMAFTNGLFLVFISIVIVTEAVRRLLDPGEILGGLMLGVAVIGLLVNIGAFWILHRGQSQEDLNLRGALAHVVGDLAGSVAAIAGSLVILWTGWTPIDPLLSMLVVGLILKSAYGIIWESGHILLEGAPEGLDVAAMREDLQNQVPGVAGVHHVHAWSLDERRPMVTLHLELSPGAEADETRRAVQHRLEATHQVAHATIQVEVEGCD